MRIGAPDAPARQGPNNRYNVADQNDIEMPEVVGRAVGGNAPAVQRDPNSLSPVAFMALCFLVVQNTAAVLIMRYTLTKPEEREYLTSTAVIMAECLKTAASAVLVFIQEGTLGGVVADKAELLKTGIPALLYLLQNNLQYIAVKNLHAATYQVTYQIKILTTALLWGAVFRQPLGKYKWLSLTALVAGVACVRLSELDGSHSRPQDSVNIPVGLGATFAATLTSAIAGVYFELLLKERKGTVWQRNCQMGLFSMLFGLLGMGMTEAGTTAWEKGFFHGYTRITATSIVIQGGGGLLIGVVMKYATVILKDIATTVSILLCCYLSWFLFEQAIGNYFVAGVVLVVGGVFGFAHS